MYIRETLKRWAQVIFHPLRGMPMPDFNNQYDSTIL